MPPPFVIVHRLPQITAGWAALQRRPLEALSQLVVASPALGPPATEEGNTDQVRESVNEL
jgi:hypothetical protein